MEFIDGVFFYWSSRMELESYGTRDNLVDTLMLPKFLTKQFDKLRQLISSVFGILICNKGDPESQLGSTNVVRMMLMVLCRITVSNSFSSCYFFVLARFHQCRFLFVWVVSFYSG